MTHPTACHCCGFRATGIGIATKTGNQWLCPDCAKLARRIATIKRLDPLEQMAIDGGIEAANKFMSANGADLSKYNEENARMMIKAIWTGCAERMRAIIGAGA